MAVMPTINEINGKLAMLADGSQVRYLNINDKLADENGTLLEGMMRDGLHLTVMGYQVWADALKPLSPTARSAGGGGPAPPPTGDPSAAGRPSSSRTNRGRVTR